MEITFELLIYFLAGFAAQLVDGALGMAYGLTATALMLSMGVTPITASASVHAAEVVTTAVSGTSHALHKNVRTDLLWRLAVPGVVGAATGTHLLINLPTEYARPVVAAYLLIMGVLLLLRNFRNKPVNPNPKLPGPLLGFIAGMIDAAGGGGWGSVTVSTLLTRGFLPRHVIGTVCAAEFFVSLTAAGSFYHALGNIFTSGLLGLIIGGVIAAPIAARFAGRMPAKLATTLVACLLILTSALTVVRALIT